MTREVNLYEVVNNDSLGRCHLIDKKKGGCNGFIYLFYCEENSEHFIVCEGVSDNYFFYANYFKKLDSAIKAFKNLR